MKKGILNTIRKAFSTNCKISADETRTVVACISSTAVDREGDVLVAQGLNSKDFEANPCVMLQHNYFGLPVAKVTALKRTEDQVLAKVQFAARPADHPADEEWVPDTLFSLYQQGVMNAFSVGFIPTDYRVANGSDIRKYGDDCKQVINRWKLLELSVVGIPCNQEAVAMAVSKGFVTQATADKLFKPAEVKAEDESLTKEDKQDVADAIAVLDDPEGVETKTLEEAKDELGLSDPPVKEVRREIAPAKRVASLVDFPEPVVPTVKHVHKFIEPPPVEVAEKTRKVVVRTVAKLRGRIYSVDGE